MSLPVRHHGARVCALVVLQFRGVASLTCVCYCTVKQQAVQLRSVLQHWQKRLHARSSQTHVCVCESVIGTPRKPHSGAPACLVPFKGSDCN